MLSDIEIAQKAHMLPITEVALLRLPQNSASVRKILSYTAATRQNFPWI